MREDVILGCLLIALALVLLGFGFLAIDRGVGEIVNLKGEVVALNFVPKHWHRSGGMVRYSRWIPDSWYAAVKAANRQAELKIPRELFNQLAVGAPVIVECIRGRWSGWIYLSRIISKA